MTSTPTPLFSISDEFGMEARVFANSDGVRFNVTLYDLDACETVPTFFIVPHLETAIAKAKSLVCL